MRGLPTRLWTCDKCGRQETVLADGAPQGWRYVHSEALAAVRTARDEPITVEWCETCADVYLTPLAEEADRG